ncbi:hypothetical protein E4L96_02025 [Massilia arenosa]|uniref:Uncharacterized protein n=1 Tax=Zemynaea arenosa TaxID=2561931 RepID=A0A4Y9STT0_9BURK|nr:hypothetical protein [Massilia arenosa]TFW28739.1 hypothetical protein E4L96_02025 [Massilia arenosa]
MKDIATLEYEYFLLRYAWGTGAGCVEWAVTRLSKDEEGDDLEVVLLASARGRDEISPLVATILERYCGADRASDEYMAGKYVAALRRAYRLGEETVESLDIKFTAMYSTLGYPPWLTMLSRNCEYALDIPIFEEPFEKEFEYVASVWAAAASLAEFYASYSRATSNSHDIASR